MADETTPTPPPSTPPAGFFSRPPQRPAASPFVRPTAPARPPSGPAPTGEPPAAEDAALGSSEPHPWTRYFARLTDIVVGGLGLGIVLGIVAPGVAQKTNDALLGLFILFAWVFVETALLATWGTTPGKWIFGIRLRTAGGGRLDPGAALGRSFAVWLRGLGLGIPIVCLFTLVRAYNRLKETGATSWDADGGFEVRHEPLQGGRLALLVAIAALWAGLAVLGSMK